MNVHCGVRHSPSSSPHASFLLKILFVALLGALALSLRPVEGYASERKVSFKVKSPAHAPLTIFIAGDVLLGRGIVPALKSGASGTSLRSYRPFIKQADLAFCNLECAFSEHAFATSTRLVVAPENAGVLADCGFDLVSTANNHALDDGSRGVGLAQAVLSRNRLASIGSLLIPYRSPSSATASSAGAEPWPAWETTVRGRRIAWLAASAWGPFMAGAARVRPLAGSGLLEQVRHLAPRVLVFVSLHWGVEGSQLPTEGQRHFAHQLIDAGAIAVIGHHPHVVQPVEVYRGQPIFYSLGNFLFDRMPKPQSGLAAILSIDGTHHVTFHSFAVQPVPLSLQDSTPATQRKVQLKTVPHLNDSAPEIRMLALPVIARRLLPRNERLMKVLAVRLLAKLQSKQLVIWSRDVRGHHLRAFAREDAKWRLLAQGHHAAIFDMQCGDVIGAGASQIVLGLRQRSKLDVRVRNRLHVYDLNPRGGFRPRWRGSALSRPFRAYALLANSAGRGRVGLYDLVAIEKNPLPAYRNFDWVTVYRWNGFGFRILWDTPVRGKVQYLRTGQNHGPFIRFEQVNAGTTRTLTLRPQIEAKNGDITYKASVEK